MTGSERESRRLRKKDKPDHLNKSRRKSHLPGHCPGTDGDKETASHNHPAPASIGRGGGPSSIYFSHGFDSFFFFSKLFQQPSYDLERVCCPVTSRWHSRIGTECYLAHGLLAICNQKSAHVCILLPPAKADFSHGKNAYYVPVKYDYL